MPLPPLRLDKKKASRLCGRCRRPGHRIETCKVPDEELTKAALRFHQREEKKVGGGKVKVGEPSWGMKMAAEIRQDLNPTQRVFVDSKKKRKGAVCSRRAGKTWGCVAKMLVVALENPECLVPYITISRRVARRIVWPMLQRFNRKYALQLKFNNVELEVLLPNGSQIWVTGATDEQDIEKLRGSAYHLVVIDECASFGAFFSKMIEEVIEPALEDYDGELDLIGTPSAACAGYFFNVTTDRKTYPYWEIHHWTVLDNPQFPRWAGKENWQRIAKSWFEDRKREKGWADDDPVMQREWLGNWVRDEGGLVYRFDPSRNTYSLKREDGTDAFEWTNGEWRFVLGIDLGFDDASAFALLAYSLKEPRCYLVEDHKRSGMTTDDIALQIKAWQTKYENIGRIVIDTGGLGKMIAEELRKRHKIGLHPAEKTAKYSYIALMNSDLVTGRFKALKDSGWAAEASMLQWNEDRNEEDPRFDNHLCDAVLYAWREAAHWQSKVRKEEEPAAGSPEAMRKVERAAFERALARSRRKSEPLHKAAMWRPTSNREVVGFH